MSETVYNRIISDICQILKEVLNTAGRDGRGPLGQGAFTGRGMGICEGARQARLPFGRGCGQGLGRRGRNGYGLGGEGVAATDKDLLKEERELLKQRMDQIDQALED